jgi:hypothetical protein
MIVDMLGLLSARSYELFGARRLSLRPFDHHPLRLDANRIFMYNLARGNILAPVCGNYASENLRRSPTRAIDRLADIWLR